MAKVRGECLYCSNRLPLYLKLKNADFCSDAHKSAYYDEQQRLALQRLIETEKILSSARAKKLPPRESRGLLFGDQTARLPSANSQGSPALAGPFAAVPQSFAPRQDQSVRIEPAAPIIALAYPSGPPLDPGTTSPPEAPSEPATPEEAAGAVEAASDGLASLALTTLEWSCPIAPVEAPPVECSGAFPFAPQPRFPILDISEISRADEGGLDLAVAVADRTPAAAVDFDGHFASSRSAAGGDAGDATAHAPRLTPVLPATLAAAPLRPVIPDFAPMLPGIPRVPGACHPGPVAVDAAAGLLAVAPNVPAFEPRGAGPHTLRPAGRFAGSGVPAPGRGEAGGAIASAERPRIATKLPAFPAAAPGRGDPLQAATAVAAERRIPAKDWNPKVYGPVQPARCGAALPVLEVPLVTGEPLAPARGIAAPSPIREGLPAAIAIAPPHPLRRGAAVPAHAIPGPMPARSIDALRRARDTGSSTPPMCVRMVPARSASRPVDDRSTSPPAPASRAAVPAPVAIALPFSGLEPLKWETPPARETLPIVPPRFQQPPEAPPPPLRPVLPLPLSPSAGAPTPPFRRSPRIGFRRLADRVTTPAGLAIVTAILLLSVWRPVMSYLGGANGLGSPAGGVVTGMRQAIGSRSGVRFVEDFQSRFDKWEGRRDPEETWKVDEAGFVVPGELAVFKPSQRMSDYRVELLGGIERKALSWAYRVKDLQNYYVARVVIVRPGPLPGLALERYAVLGGKETTHRTNPISLTIRGESMMRVSMNANGSDFDIRIDGRIVDSWSDDRIETGGVGLFSGKGESSKIRWVNVDYQYDILGRVCSWFAASPVIRESSR